MVFDIGLADYKIRINNDMVQVLSKPGINQSPTTSIFDENGCVWNIDGEACVSYTAYLKPKLIKKNI